MSMIEDRSEITKLPSLERNINRNLSQRKQLIDSQMVIQEKSDPNDYPISSLIAQTVVHSRFSTKKPLSLRLRDTSTDNGLYTPSRS